MFYGRYDQASRTLRYASGGHNPPILMRPKTGETLLLEDAGPILGILDDAEFSNSVVALEHGDILVLYTDGVTEQENETSEEFAIDRLKEVIKKSEADSAATVVAHVSEAVSDFAGVTEQADDLIVGIDGAPARTVDDLQRLLDESRIGKLCVLRILRGPQPLYLSVTPLESPRS